MNVTELALKSLNEGKHVSYIFEGQELTNVYMNKLSNRLGNALKKIGVKKGDRVIIQVPNCPEVLQSFQAIWKVGAIAVPINYQFHQEDVNYVYKDSGAVVVISSPDYLEKVTNGLKALDKKIDVIMIASEVPEGTLSFAKLQEENSDNLEIEPMDNDDVATLIYTSGTTGRPKGVMLTHGNHKAAAEMVQDTMKLPNDLISLATLPLCHSFGVATMNAAFLRTKGTVIIMRQFNINLLFQNIDQYKVQSLPGVPTIFVYMLLYPEADKYDLSSLKYVLCGSAPLATKTFEEFKERWSIEISEGWGLTEAGATNTIQPVDKPIKVGSVGAPINGMKMKIVDFDGNEVPTGEKGEILISGPMVMKGYWNLPEETASNLKDGWLCTGDIGFVDEEGYYYITDRKKELIIKGGENISPSQIEQVIMRFPKVAEAAVVGIDDDVCGEEIRAFVTLKPEFQATPEEIMDFCNENLMKFHVPKEICIIDAFPKTVLGKILKKELKKLA